MAYEQTPDEVLMLDFQAGEESLVKMIYERYKQPIFNFCLRILGNRADAEDATSEVFLSLFSKKYIFDPKAKFSTWIYTIARNSCIDKLRKKKFSVSFWFKETHEGKETFFDTADSRPNSRERLDDSERSDLIKEAIQGLPLEQKEAIVLREYQALSYEEIAVILNCSLEKTKILIFRAREHLRVKLSSLIQGEQT
jgi:RNA polymerase sigma-70 factor (ECF subfamily)